MADKGTNAGADRSSAGLAALSEDRLFRLTGEGDARAREELVGRFLPLARRLAGRYRHTNEPQEDLEQVAYMALVKAVDRFDPDVGSFIPYAVPSILGELKRHFRDKGWAMRVPRSLKERHLKVAETIEILTARDGRSPSPGTLAETLDLELEEVLEAIEAGSAYAPGTLDGPARRGDEEGHSIADTLGREDERFELIELGQTVAPAFAALPEREQQILRLRFVDDMTQADIAGLMGISQMHVSRLIRRSIEELREATGAD